MILGKHGEVTFTDGGGICDKISSEFNFLSGDIFLIQKIMQSGGRLPMSF